MVTDSLRTGKELQPKPGNPEMFLSDKERVLVLPTVALPPCPIPAIPLTGNRFFSETECLLGINKMMKANLCKA